MSEDPLRKLARLHGILTSFHDVAGVLREATDDALRLALTALGISVTEDADLPALIEAAKAARAVTTPEPVVVAWDGGPDGLEPGYHERTLLHDGEEYVQLVISAPRRAYGADRQERTHTGFLPLYAVRGDRDWGAGDYTDLGALAAHLGRHGGRFATLPLNAAFLDVPFEPSPYSPASRLFWNELYLDLTSIPELESCSEARALLESDAFRRQVEDLRRHDFMEARRLMGLKRGILRLLADRLFSGESDRRTELERYVSARPELREYAAFRAETAARGEPWPTWDSPAREGRLEPSAVDQVEYRYHQYVQWLAESQVQAAAETARSSGGGLVLDLPLGAMTDGYDVWRHREVFAMGVSGGAPPDELGPDGQDWGFPPLHPEGIRRDQYRYVRACLRHLMAPADCLRVDHVMGLHRLYWVPWNHTPADGVYVRYPSEELWAVISLESHLNRCRVVGENLGTVPDEVNAAMEEHGVRGMFVVPFEIRPDRDPPLRKVAPGQQASLNTHDLPAFATWWKDLASRDRDALRRWLAGERGVDVDDTAAVFEALTTHLAASDAGEIVINLEDLWGETRPQNIPGTGQEVPNFRRRATRTLGEIESDPEQAAFLTEVAALRKGSLMSASEETRAVRQVGFITADDLYLFNEGSELNAASKFGSHPMTVEGVSGTHFAVWAPNAERVGVMGEFNGWDRERHLLASQGSSGVFAGFIQGVGKGELYKYCIHSRERAYRVEKADPFAVLQEEPPRTGSVVWDLEYEWGDAEWMASRGERNSLAAPISVYEVHLGSWMRSTEEGRRSLTYRELAPRLAEYVAETGYTHVEFLPVMEHPFYGSWGYQVTGFFAPSSRFGTPQDFMFLVDTLHQAGVGVILDWVPSHFPKDQHGLGYFDGTHLFEHSDPQKGLHPDWDSLIFNYGRNEVRSFLMSTAFHWLREFHADGLRTDAVASMLYLDYSRKDGEWIPNEFGGRENLEAISFLRRLNEEIYGAFPDVQMIAEESTAFAMVSRPTFAGGLGFGMKWDMGWMHDTLAYLEKEPVHRKFHHGELTFRQIYAFTENFMLSLSHDEVVHGKRSLLEKMSGDDWQKFANLRLLFAYQFTQSGKKLSFMGGEIAQRREWNHDDSLDWHLLEHAPHAGVRELVKDLNRLYRDEPALHARDCEPTGFDWIDCHDAESGVLSYLRRGGDPEETVLVVCHFTPLVRESYRLGVPCDGDWRVLLNSDDARYEGSGAGATEIVTAEDVEANRRPFSLDLSLPPLGVLVLKPSGG